MTYQTKKAKEASIPAVLLTGFGISWAVTVCAAVTETFLVAGEQIGEGMMTTWAVGTVILAVFIGALVASIKSNSRKLAISLICGGSYFVSLLCVNLLFYGGSFQGIWASILTILGASLLAGLLSLRQRPNSFKRKKRYR